MKYISILPLLIILIVSPLNLKAQESSDTSGGTYLGERPAAFPGGMRAFYQFLSQNMMYPEEALNQGIEGRVYVWLVLDETGQVIDDSIRIHRGVHKLLDDESVRLIRLSPDWIPAKIGADLKPIASKVAFPITYHLPDEYKSNSKKKKKKKNKRS